MLLGNFVTTITDGAWDHLGDVTPFNETFTIGETNNIRIGQCDGTIEGNDNITIGNVNFDAVDGTIKVYNGVDGLI